MFPQKLLLEPQNSIKTISSLSEDIINMQIEFLQKETLPRSGINRGLSVAKSIMWEKYQTQSFKPIARI